MVRFLGLRLKGIAVELLRFDPILPTPDEHRADENQSQDPDT